MSEQTASNQLEIAHTVRDALRKVRRGAVDGAINPDQMQALAKNTTDQFARTLLSIKNPTQLKPEDRDRQVESHLEALNHYVKGLIPQQVGNEKLLNTGQKLDQNSLLLMLSVLTKKSYLDKNLGVDDNQIIVPLSTGATMLAITAYLHELPIYFAAVSGDYAKTFIPPLDTNRGTIIIDDVVGRQVNKIAKDLKDQGHTQIKTTGLI